MSEISKLFRLNGINIRSDAAQYLASVVADRSAKERKSLVEQVIRHLQRQSESSLVISKEEIEIAVKEFTIQDDSTGTDFFWVYDSFDIQQIFYDPDKKHFTHASVLGKSPPDLHETADFKNFAFVERYEALFQRTLRNPFFVRPSMEKKGANHKFTLLVIEELLSSAAPLRNVVVLGMLSSLQEGKYHLEDPSGAIQLQITAETSFTSGLFTENIFVIAEGWYDERIFYATGIGMPPAESRADTDKIFGSFNFFGGTSQVSLRASPKLKRLEQQHADSMFVILADVYLDQPKVLEKLEEIFRGMADTPPFCFILCGDFVSETENLNHADLLKSGLRALQLILQRYRNVLDHSKFVFVPGPMDIGISGILPRPPLPKNLTRDFEAVVKNAIFTTNPCRIQFCTREMFVIREDILTKMCRTLIKDPACGAKENRFQQLTVNLAKTIICQGHLCPLPGHVLPLHWSYDHALRLSALPDVIIAADMQEPFVANQSDCLVASPSSFPRHKFQFHVYWPAHNTIELSQV